MLLTVFSGANIASTRSVPDAFTKNHAELLDRNPDGLVFALKLKDNKTQFHMGEIIRLELSFSSTRPDTYVMNTASYDRGGRLGIDRFVLDPTAEV